MIFTTVRYNAIIGPVGAARTVRERHTAYIHSMQTFNIDQIPGQRYFCLMPMVPRTVGIYIYIKYCSWILSEAFHPPLPSAYTSFQFIMLYTAHMCMKMMVYMAGVCLPSRPLPIRKN